MSGTTAMLLLLKAVFAVLLVLLIPFGVAFVLLLWTGEIILYLFSFGGHKPRWGISAIMGRSWGLELISQVSAYVGAAFWLLALVLLRNLW
jgi:hypothetical protein